jgi:O-antigen/teichoic acid export membrane protein
MSSRKVTTDVLVSGATRAAIRFRGLIFIPVITISLGIEAFGAYAQILAVVNLLELIFGLGLYTSLVRYGRRTERLADLYYSLLVVTTLSAGAVSLVIALFATELSALTLGSTEYADAFRLGALLTWIRAVFRLTWNYFRIDSRIKLFSAIEGLKAYGIVAVVTVSVLFLDAGLVGLFLSMVLLEVFTIVVIQVKIVREIGVTVPSFRNLRMHLKYSVPVALSSLAGNVSSRADRVMIGFFLGASAVGVYSIAYQIATAITMFVTPIRQTFFPEFSKFIDEGELQKCSTYLRTGIRYFLIVALPSVAGMYLIGPDVISLLTAGQGIPSPLVIAVIALGIVAQGVEQLYGVIMDAIEETGRRAKFLSIGAVVNILINVVAIPSFEILGAAVATLLTYLLVSALTMWRVNQLVPTALPKLTIVRSSGASFAMLGAASTVFGDRILLTVVFSAPLYFGLLFVSRELTFAELRKRMTAQ